MGGTLFLDPALLFLLVGLLMLLIGFAGCVGSLRENTCLLLFVCEKFYKYERKIELFFIL